MSLLTFEDEWGGSLDVWSGTENRQCCDAQGRGNCATKGAKQPTTIYNSFLGPRWLEDNLEKKADR